MKASFIALAGLLLCGFSTAQAMNSLPRSGEQQSASGNVGRPLVTLARNGADNKAGDDHGGRTNGGNGRGGHDDGAHHG